ncbi:PIN domain-containing protein [Mycolicibacterium boenickei]
MIYLDASAMVTYVTRRANFVELHEFVHSGPIARMMSSTVGLIETVRNCDRLGSFPNLMGRLLRDYGEIGLTPEIRDRAADLAGVLKTLDAIHVASAEMLGDELTAFITYDRQMATIARSRGMPVASPGANL